LPTRLAAYRNSTASPRVLITGDDKVKWGPLVAALDEVRKSGISQFSIETRPRPTGK
jgi:biopolymer transport protein ExbD